VSQNNNWCLDYANGPYAKNHHPLLTKEQCFLKIEELMKWADENNRRVTFAGGEDWEPLPEKDELVIQISEFPDPRKVCFAWEKIHLPRSAGGTWWDFDIWMKLRNKNKVEIT